MLKFILRKLISKKWLFLALLVGNILLVSIASSNPMYSTAVMQRMLSDDFDTYLAQKNAYPGMVSMNFNGAVNRNDRVDEYAGYCRELPARYGVYAALEIEHLYLHTATNKALVVRDDAKVTPIMQGAIDHLEDHVKLVAGRMYSPERREDGTIEVIVSQQGMIDMNLLLGEKRVFENVPDEKGNPVTIEVVGVFDAASSEDPFWVRRPASYKNEVLMDYNLFRTVFLDKNNTTQPVSATWYELLDYTQMRSDDAQRLNDVTKAIKEEYRNITFATVTISFADILSSHLLMAGKVGITMWVMQAPVYALLAVFIFMVSRQILDTEENEIAVLKSRGVKNSQIFGIYLEQSAIIAAISCAAGIPLGSLLTRALGSTNAFLNFVSRTALPVSIGRDAVLFAVCAAVLSVLTMVLPVRRFTRSTIVTHKQKKHRSAAPLWQKLGLDFVALAGALYGLYSFNRQKDFLFEQIQQGSVPDPLMFLCSSLFILGAGLVAIRLLPLPISLLYNLFKKHWSPALYASYLKVLRQRNSQNFIMVFLVMTIALGVFNSQTARAINRNAEDNECYGIGADFVLREEWTKVYAESSDTPVTETVEPDYDMYGDIPGVVSTAKVYTSGSVTVALGSGTLKKVVSVMGIDTDEFGNTCWYDESLLPLHINNYLNAMSLNARAVLVSSNFRSRGCKLGDIVNYTVDGTSTRGIIYGFVDYFPGWQPTTVGKAKDGSFAKTQNYLIVANLSQLQDLLGIRPYSVWLKTDDGGDGLYDWIEQNDKSFVTFKDTADALVRQKNEPMIRSLNGVLTVSFIVALTLCVIGFLIYWILSIKQRTLLFGIYRAMGMTMREIFTMLINEQLCISVTSILVGTGVGFLASKLYMPLIQIAYAEADAALPLRNLLSVTDTARLAVIVGVMLVLCMTVLVVIIRRMKISQALKLGED